MFALIRSVRRIRPSFAKRDLRVAVALSGGIDSAVSALLLQKQGHEVLGLHMKNWSEEDEKGFCTGEKDLEQVERICQKLDIPLEVVNFEKDYWNYVFEPMLNSYATGITTPNPDVLCNKEIKFKSLLQKAQELGGFLFSIPLTELADVLATGHYARIGFCEETQQPKLLRAIDDIKDQTYFLMQLNQSVLWNVMFPIGHMLKIDVRSLARHFGFDNADRKESMGICFIGKRKFSAFLSEYLPSVPGNFVDLDGKVVGTHEGLPFFTIGQGAAIGGSTEGKYYVVSKNPKDNSIVVCLGDKNPILYNDSLTVKIDWISEQLPEELKRNLTMECLCKRMHPGPLVPCTVSLEHSEDSGDEDGASTTIKIVFKSPERALTVGQMVCLYEDEVCLGGGAILETLNLSQRS